LSKVNAKLKGFGLPAVEKIPDGFQPLLEIYGKGKNRSPLLVTFSYPITWVVTVPSNDVNGEDGTVQAGDYGKGDTATVNTTMGLACLFVCSLRTGALVATNLCESHVLYCFFAGRCCCCPCC
jgi:hypothetical protein